MNTSATHFLLYSRSYCHLCDDMLAALQRYQDEFSFTVDIIDVDADERLVARYDELVPVLIGIRKGIERELCHYFLDRDEVIQFLRAG
jgi:thiol-disulfide isomerase/thioredoxin